MSAEASGWEPVIGLEIHAQLATASKMFCSCRNAFGAPPNSLTCPVCLGLPGALPVVNRAAVDYAVRMTLAVGGEVTPRSNFARKNYFYPDLPKGYQITQFDHPLGTGGCIIFQDDHGRDTAARIKRVHMEEDAGKLLHDEDGGTTQIDFNRCGVPLVEIVTEPDLRSPSDARMMLQSIRQVVQYLEICSGDMEKGELRCDANVSLRHTASGEPGERTEIKNLNSFKGIERALTFEIDRQRALLSAAKPIEPVTLLWNEATQTAEIMRGKEESEDYRYFPEPDLLQLFVSQEWVRSVAASLPELPAARLRRLVRQYNVREQDAAVLTAHRSLADYYETVAKLVGDPARAVGWITTELLGLVRDSDSTIESCPVSAESLAELIELVERHRISGRTGKAVLREMVTTGESPGAIVLRQGLEQVSDELELARLIDRVIENNSTNVDAYRAGKTRLLAHFVGEVMRATGGRADPSVVNRLLREKLGG